MSYLGPNSIFLKFFLNQFIKFSETVPDERLMDKSDLYFKGNFYYAQNGGQLKTLGTQMEYVFGWLSNLITRSFFGQIWPPEDVSTHLPSSL